MTNFDNMKNALISDILNMNELQLYNFFFLLEGEPDVAERFGIHTDINYTCQKCKIDHSGCSVLDMENFKNECYDAYVKYCNKEVSL